MGGVDIREYDLQELRRNFGVVLQDPYLFTGTVAENIRLGTPNISDAKMERAAERVNLLDYLDALPDRFETDNARTRSRLLYRSEAADKLRSRARA